MTRWVADRRARRVPNFVIDLTGLKTKKQIVARYGADVAFEKGKATPKPGLIPRGCAPIPAGSALPGPPAAWRMRPPRRGRLAARPGSARWRPALIPPGRTRCTAGAPGPSRARAAARPRRPRSRSIRRSGRTLLRAQQPGRRPGARGGARGAASGDRTRPPRANLNRRVAPPRGRAGALAPPGWPWSAARLADRPGSAPRPRWRRAARGQPGRRRRTAPARAPPRHRSPRATRSAWSSSSRSRCAKARARPWRSMSAVSSVVRGEHRRHVASRPAPRAGRTAARRASEQLLQDGAAWGQPELLQRRESGGRGRRGTADRASGGPPEERDDAAPPLRGAGRAPGARSAAPAASPAASLALGPVPALALALRGHVGGRSPARSASAEGPSGRAGGGSASSARTFRSSSHPRGASAARISAAPTWRPAAAHQRLTCSSVSSSRSAMDPANVAEAGTRVKIPLPMAAAHG